MKVLVFDLDDTLLDTSALLIPIADSPAFLERIQRPLPLMEGAKDNLERLRHNYRLFLLTQGDVSFQRQKIASLGIESYFESCFICDSKRKESKGGYFAKILQITQVPPEQHLSIGNRRSTDLREAKQHGYQTCFFSHGEHVNEKPEHPGDLPDFSITHHSELISTCHL